MEPYATMKLLNNRIKSNVTLINPGLYNYTVPRKVECLFISIQLIYLSTNFFHGH